MQMATHMKSVEVATALNFAWEKILSSGGRNERKLLNQGEGNACKKIQNLHKGSVAGPIRVLFYNILHNQSVTRMFMLNKATCDNGRIKSGGAKHAV